MFALLFTSAPECLYSGRPITVEAHSGRTDSNGGHHDYKNVSGLGSYHYHCGGYPAHLHTNGKCPYASSTSTGSSSSNSSSTRSSSTKTQIKLNKSAATLKEWKTLQLKVSGTSAKIIWTSSNPSVAAVNSNGKVTARKKGTATITAKTGSKSYKCKITVKALTLNKTKATLSEGESTTLKLDTTRSIKWSSSDKQVVSVNSKGKIVAKKAGKATITARIGGKSYKCKVTVKHIPKKVKLSGISIKTVNWSEYGDDVTFVIKNNTTHPITVSNIAKAYDDDYKLLTSMKMPFSNSVTIPAGSKKEITFLDFTFSSVIYYTQRIVFSFTTNGQSYKCYSEYSYNNNAPYTFSFYR